MMMLPGLCEMFDCFVGTRDVPFSRFAHREFATRVQDPRKLAVMIDPWAHRTASIQRGRSVRANYQMVSRSDKAPQKSLCCRHARSVDATAPPRRNQLPKARCISITSRATRCGYCASAQAASEAPTGCCNSRSEGCKVSCSSRPDYARRESDESNSGSGSVTVFFFHTRSTWTIFSHNFGIGLVQNLSVGL